jgi:gamma-glutamyl:cysteine ligase YbdK (ATP-grasp superfamily)
LSDRAPLHLFAGFGVELEYMIVDAATLSVRPIADELLHTLAGGPASDYNDGDISLSNELVAHVIELKTNGPAPALVGLEDKFQAMVNKVNGLLAASGARLMPGAAHPWMDPDTETRLWPGDSGDVYRAFDRIFNCRGHGWSNLQSVHLNLPFADDEEFGRLHAAIRLLLPILPALAASSPVIEGRVQPALDARLTYYRTNCARIPSATGRVIPEPVFTQADYDDTIFQPLYADIAPHDPEGILQEEWLNARGAIARFTRNAIEIRVLDIQECPQADLAIVRLIVAVLKALINERWCSFAEQKSWPVEPLEAILLNTINQAEAAEISPDYARPFGWNSASAATAQALWRHLYDTLRASGDLRDEPCLEVILRHGTLARRLVNALGQKPSAPRSRLAQVYGSLCDCLARGQMFVPQSPE